MSIQNVNVAQSGPIIRGLANQETRRTANTVTKEPAVREAAEAIAHKDTFEASPVKTINVHESAQLRRVAAQQQASTVAPNAAPAAAPVSAPSVTTTGAVPGFAGPVNPTPLPAAPTPPVDAVPLPGAVDLPTSTPEVIPSGFGIDAPDDVETTPTPSKTPKFNQADLANLKQSLGLTAGQKGFNSAYDLNADGVINGTDLAHLLTRFDPNAKAADQPSPEQPTKLTPQQLLDGVLKHFGANVKSEGVNGAYDLNHDGAINGQDLAHVLTQWNANHSSEVSDVTPPSQSRSLHALLSAFGSQPGDGVFSRTLDLNNDGAINGADLAHYLTAQRKNDDAA